MEMSYSLCDFTHWLIPQVWFLSCMNLSYVQVITGLLHEKNKHIAIQMMYKWHITGVIGSILLL